MSRKIRIKRGVKADIPALDIAELGFTTDTEEVYVGNSGGNVKVVTQPDLDVVNQQLADMVVNVKGFQSEVIDGDWAYAFQAAVDSLGNVGGTVFAPAGEYAMKSGVLITKNNIYIEFSPAASIRNEIVGDRNTYTALFEFRGSMASYGLLANDFKVDTNVVVLDKVDGLSIGDTLGFYGDFSARNISKIVSINVSTKAVTLDRKASNEVLTGRTVHKINPIKNSGVKSLNVDFNGKYGYGTRLDKAMDCFIKDVRSNNVGNMVVHVTGSIDSIVDNVSCYDGFDVADGGGHSYVVRVAVSNDIKVNNIFGSNLRHVVDITGGSRNTVSNCEGRNNPSADFLTHSNNSKDNVWINNNSYDNGTAAYAFDPSNGDTGNKVIGGYIENSIICYHTQDGTNTFESIRFKSGTKYPITGHNPNFVLNKCYFETDYPLIAVTTGISNITFNDCVFKTNGLRAICSLPNTQVTSNVITFNNCVIEVFADTYVFEYGDGTLLKFRDCTITSKLSIKSVSHTLNDLGTGRVEAVNSQFKFEFEGNYMFSLRDGSKLTFDKCTFKNMLAGIARKFTAGELVLNDNSFVNTPMLLSNFTNATMTTISMSVLPTIPTPPTTGIWSKNSKVLNKDMTAGSYVGYVCTVAGTPGVWKGFGLIQA